jgi:Flp pilus assembly protein TadD
MTLLFLPMTYKANTHGHRTLVMACYPEACDASAKAEELSPEDANLRRNLALALQNAGRSAEAWQAFADAKRLRPPAN